MVRKRSQAPIVSIDAPKKIPTITGREDIDVQAAKTQALGAGGAPVEGEAVKQARKAAQVPAVPDIPITPTAPAPSKAPYVPSYSGRFPDEATRRLEVETRLTQIINEQNAADQETERDEEEDKDHPWYRDVASTVWGAVGRVEDLLEAWTPERRAFDMVQSILHAEDDREKVRAAWDANNVLFTTFDTLIYEADILNAFDIHYTQALVHPETGGDINGVSFWESVSSADMPNLPQESKAAMVDRWKTMQGALDEMSTKPADVEVEPADGLVGFDDDLTPDMVAPSQDYQSTEMMALHEMSMQDIARVLAPPEIPISMSEQEYQNLFELPPDFDAELAESLTGLTGLIEEHNEMRSHMRTEGFDMPDYDIWDAMKLSFMQPMQVSADMLEGYFNKVPRPIASFALMQTPFGQGQLNDLYDDYRGTGMNPWDAASEAYQEWDVNWGVKMLLEMPFDLSTYMGWGIVGKLPVIGAKGLPGLRLIGKADLAMYQGFDQFADAIKKAGPKLWGLTNGQKSILSGSADLRTIEAWTTFTTGKHLRDISTKQVSRVTSKGATVTTTEWREVIRTAINTVSKGKRTGTEAWKAGAALLRHDLLDEKAILKWSDEVGGQITAETINKETMLNVNEVFERMFWKEAAESKESSATRLVSMLGGDATPENIKTAMTLMKSRRDRIFAAGRAVGDTDDTYKAMRNVRFRNQKVQLKNLNHAVRAERLDQSRLKRMLYDIDPTNLSIWGRTMQEYWVMPMAKAYLTFGMFGPWNVIEDLWRSFVAGVRPGLLGTEDWRTFKWGLKADPMLEAEFMSETGGRLTGLMAKADWPLEFMLSPLGIAAWAITKGELSPRSAGQFAYGFLVKAPGGVSASIRRNFVYARHMQILQANEPEMFKMLQMLGDEKLLGAVPASLRKEMSTMVKRMSITGNPKLVRQLMDDVTYRKLGKREVEKILNNFPDLPVAAREIVMDAWKKGKLFDGVPKTKIEWDAGLKYMSEMETKINNAIVDDFLRSPKMAEQEFDNLARIIGELELDKIEDIALIAQTLHHLTSTYGTTPTQILKQASIRSRGLPLEERSANIIESIDRLYGFLDNAGTSMDEIAKKVRTASDRMIAGEPLIEILTPNNAYRAALGGQPFRARLFRGTKGSELWNRELGTDPGLYGRGTYFTPSEGYAEGFVKEPGKVIEKEVTLERPFTNEEAVGGIGDIKREFDLANPGLAHGPEYDAKIADYIRTRVEDLGYDGIVLGSPSSGNLHEVIVFHPEKSVANLGTAAKTAAPELETFGRLMNDFLDETAIRTAKAKLFRQENLAWRSQYFAGVTKKQMKESKFWDMFYHDLDIEWARFEADMLASKSKLIGLAKNLDIYEGGFNATSRTKPVVIRNRPMNQQDVADLVGAQVDDLSKAILGVMVAENNKAYFVQRVMSMLMKGDVGVTEDGVARVYDEIVRGLRIFKDKPNTPGDMTWLTRMQAEASGVTDELHKLYNTVLLTPADKKAVDNFIGDAATKLEELGIDPVKLQAARQTAQDEAEKWYYKEFTDYTNQNRFDGMMKAIYPFWNYEVQRWPWAVRSFMRRPATFAALNRYNQNSDMGYLDIPGVPVDINPFRGSIYGPFTTTLVRGNFPEYYDNMPPGLSQAAQLNDWYSHYGFYPGAHVTLPLALLGGATPQTGEVLPPMATTGMSMLQAMFPKSEPVQFLANKIFPNRFRNYLVSVEVASRGYEGGLMQAKIEQGIKLSEEEQDIWDDAQRRVAGWNIIMEQGALFRYRPDEYSDMKEASREAIHEVYGITPLQQDWMQRHGFNLWEQLGGMTPAEQMALEELQYFSMPRAGAAGLGPSRIGDAEQRLTIDWDDVEKFSDNIKLEADIEWDRFLNGEMGVDQLDDLLIEGIQERHNYIEEKINQNPLMDWDERLAYKEKTGQNPPVRAPLKELVSMWYEIELEMYTDEETGVYGPNWDKFFAQRRSIELAIPEENTEEWNAFLSRNMHPMEILRKEVNRKYFSKYYDIHEVTLEQRPEDEQALLREYYALLSTGRGIGGRREEIKNVEDVCGDKLVSSFERARSRNREALREANPHLDAWLAYWQKTTTVKTEAAMGVLQHLFNTTNRVGFTG